MLSVTTHSTAYQARQSQNQNFNGRILGYVIPKITRKHVKSGAINLTVEAGKVGVTAGVLNHLGISLDHLFDPNTFKFAKVGLDVAESYIKAHLWGSTMGDIGYIYNPFNTVDSMGLGIGKGFSKLYSLFARGLNK